MRTSKPFPFNGENMISYEAVYVDEDYATELPCIKGRTHGCGCCSDTEILKKDEAIKAIKENITYWELRLKEIESFEER